MRVQRKHNVLLAIEWLQLQAHLEQLRSRLRGGNDGKGASRKAEVIVHKLYGNLSARAGSRNSKRERE
jgi:hypothetical protein